MNELKYYTNLYNNRVGSLKPCNQWKPEVLVNTLMNLQRNKKIINHVNVDTIWLGFYYNNTKDFELDTIFKNAKHTYNLSNIRNELNHTYISVWCLYDSNHIPTNQVDITFKKQESGINEGSYMIYDITYKKNYLDYDSLINLMNELS